jgi:hypothetical protein
LELPHGVNGFFEEGKTANDLLTLSEAAVFWPPSSSGAMRVGPYECTSGGMAWHKPTQHGPVRTPLTNFSARITADVLADDGVEKRREYEIEANLRGRTIKCRIPANQFASLNWVPEHLGGSALIEAGQTKRDHARAAIQHFSGEIPEKVVYEHLGWTQIGNDWYYLHADGSIGPNPDWADGTVGAVAEPTTSQKPNIEVYLPSDLRNYSLPNPPCGNDLVNAVRKSLEFLSIGPDTMTFPLYAAIYAPIVSQADYSMFGTGQTGTFKTSVEALCLQHYGSKMDAGALPGHWTGTGNALEYAAFLAKDALFLIDDYVPGSSAASMQDLNNLAERIFRGQANKGGRQRMNRNLKLAGMKVPRCLIISSGEDVPLGHSLRGRMMIIEFSPNRVDLGRLTGPARRSGRGHIQSGIGWIHSVGISAI